MPSRASKNTTDISFAIAFVNVLYCRYLGLSIQKRVTALQASGLKAWVCGEVRARGANETGDALAKGGNGGAVTLVGNYAK